MKKRLPIQLILALGLGLTTFGADNSGQARLSSAMRETRDEIIETRAQLQSSVDAISALAAQKTGDLRPAYDNFVEQVKRTRHAALVTRNRSQKMQEEANAHFSDWKTELDSINNQKLKKKALKRLDGVQKSYDRVVKQLQGASEKFTPYLSDLEDMQKMLAKDLNPNAVKAIKSTVSNAKFHLQSVRGPINDAINDLTKMQKALTTSAGG
jgi:hypothetical protein